MAVLSLLLELSWPQTILLSLSVLASSIVIYYVVRWYQVRTLIRRVKAAGMPVMAHSFLLGHLPIVAKLMAEQPHGLHSSIMGELILDRWREFFPDQIECPGVLVIDVWPMAPPILMLIDQTASQQAIIDAKLPKAINANRYLAPLTQNLDLVSSHGLVWKSWRARLNPGFSVQNVVALVPQMLDEVEVFRDLLKGKAGEGGSWGEPFPFESLATNLTIDVIARAVLDIRLHEQTTGPSKFTTALLDILGLLRFEFNLKTYPFLLSPSRNYAVWRDNRVMRQELLPHVEDRIRASSKPKTSSSSNLKTVVDLALKAFKDESALLGPDAAPPKPDALFVDTVLAQLKVFMFAGHDTTATTIAWAVHFLSRDPSSLARLRAEHDAVLGADAAAALRARPNLVNALPFTTAVIKETMRLYPAAAQAREGVRGATVTVQVHPRGEDAPRRPLAVACPTEGFMILDNSRSGMRLERNWPRAAEFVPERWLFGDDGQAEKGKDPAADDDDVGDDPRNFPQPPKNAWRPFGIGPRNCIGQELAIVEMKLALALVVRDVDVECAWDEWDRARGVKGPQAQYKGHRCYSVGTGTPHCVEGMPVHVRLRH